MGLKKHNRSGVAFDAASSSGMAFLSSQLELANTNLVQPLASVSHQRDITVKFGGGFVEFLTAYQADYASTGNNQYGLQGTSNSDIPQVQASIGKGSWKAWNWASSLTVTYIDVKRLQAAKRIGQPAPFSLNTLLETGTKIVWNKAMDLVVYLGWMGQPGLCNNPSVVAALVAAVGNENGYTNTTLWAGKTPVQILNDVNGALIGTVQASGYDVAGMADTLLVSWTKWAVLNQPMTTGGFSSLLEYILKNNVAERNGIKLKIFPLPNPYITGQGIGGTDRMVAYRNSEDNVYIHVPQPINKAFTLPTTQNGGSYETIYNGCISQVIWLRTQTASYNDGI